MVGEGLGEGVEVGAEADMVNRPLRSSTPEFPLLHRSELLLNSNDVSTLLNLTSD